MSFPSTCSKAYRLGKFLGDVNTLRKTRLHSPYAALEWVAAGARVPQLLCHARQVRGCCSCCAMRGGCRARGKPAAGGGRCAACSAWLERGAASPQLDIQSLSARNVPHAVAGLQEESACTTLWIS